MSLIKCPECGQDLSDHAKTCPHCGYILKKRKKLIVPSKLSGKGKKYLLSISSIIIVVLIVLIVIASLPKHNTPLEGRQNIKISDIKLVGENDSYDKYNATVTSESKEPCIATIGKSSNMTYKYVYIDEGKGNAEISIDYDESLDDSYAITGYINGTYVSNKLLKTYSNKNENYQDYDSLQTSFLSSTIEIELNKVQTGILVFELYDKSKNISEICTMQIFDGKGSCYTKITIPYETRDVTLKVKPMFFCSMQELLPKDYNVISELKTIKKTDVNDYDAVEYDSLEPLELKNINNGILIYTFKEKNSDNDIYRTEEIVNGKSQVTIYNSIDLGEEDDVEPEYDIEIKGYIPVGEVKSNGCYEDVLNSAMEKVSKTSFEKSLSDLLNGISLNMDKQEVIQTLANRNYTNYRDFEDDNNLMYLDPAPNDLGFDCQCVFYDFDENNELTSINYYDQYYSARKLYDYMYYIKDSLDGIEPEIIQSAGIEHRTWKFESYIIDVTYDYTKEEGEINPLQVIISKNNNA